MDTDLMDTLQYSYVEYGFIYYALVRCRDYKSVLTYPIDVKHTLVC